MAVPKKRTSSSKRDMRRSHHALPSRFTVVCQNCGAPKERHRMCGSCGHYRGRLVQPPKVDKSEATA